MLLLTETCDGFIGSLFHDLGRRFLGPGIAALPPVPAAA